MYGFGLQCRQADEMPPVDSPHLVEWILHEVGPLGLNAASYIGWRHVWWWINRGRNERPDGTVLIDWGQSNAG